MCRALVKAKEAGLTPPKYSFDFMITFGGLMPPDHPHLGIIEKDYPIPVRKLIKFICLGMFCL